LPDEAGSAALYEHHLCEQTLDPANDRATVAAELAAATEGCTCVDVGG
jgi:hypothetical protein